MKATITSHPVNAFALSAECQLCCDVQHSEPTIGNSANPSVLAHAIKEFQRHLKERGWDVGRLICKDCCDSLVIERVGAAFKDKIAAKAGGEK